MKILLVTPLYPPDVAEPAPYIKECGVRLSDKHEVVILTYGQFPEEIPGVRIVAVSKQKPVVSRVLTFTLALMREARSANVLYVENGPSVELPFLVAKLFSNRRYVLHIGDSLARRRSTQRMLLHFLRSAVEFKANAVIVESPPPRPEILPFQEYPTLAFTNYESAWRSHIHMIEKVFSTYE